MFATVLKELTGQLGDKRFVLNAFFPVLAFTTALLAVILNGQDGIAAGIDAWQKRDGTTQVVLAIVAVTLLYVAASVVAGAWLAIIRLYEGYSGPAKWCGAKGTAWHTAELQRHWTAADYHHVYYRYPLAAAEVMPTLLGNVLRSSESYARERYGMDTAVVWPRLFPLLGKEVSQGIAEARSSLESMLVISLLSTVFALVTGPYVVVTDGPVWLFLVCTAGALTIAYATYRAGVANAVVYGQHIRSAVDLYRSLVFEQLRIRPPSTLHEERRRWQEVNDLLYRNVPPPWVLASKPAK
jgi:hypothetical protein